MCLDRTKLYFFRIEWLFSDNFLWYDEPHFSSAFFVIWLAEMVAAGKIGKNN